MKIKTGWEIQKASPSDRGGLRIEGINHDAEEIDRNFIWEISEYGITDPRFNWSKCTFAPGATYRKEMLEKMAAIKNQK